MAIFRFSNSSQIVDASVNLALRGAVTGEGPARNRWPWRFVQAPEEIVSELVTACGGSRENCLDQIRRISLAPNGDDLKDVLGKSVSEFCSSLDQEHLEILCTGLCNFGPMKSARYNCNLEFTSFSMTPPFDETEDPLKNLQSSLRWLQADANHAAQASIESPAPLAVLAIRAPEMLYRPITPNFMKDSWILEQGVMRSTVAVVNQDILTAARAKRRDETIVNLNVLWTTFSEKCGENSESIFRETARSIAAVSLDPVPLKINIAYANTEEIRNMREPTWLIEYVQMSYSEIREDTTVPESTIGEWLTKGKKIGSGTYAEAQIFRKWNEKTYVHKGWLKSKKTTNNSSPDGEGATV